MIARLVGVAALAAVMVGALPRTGTARQSNGASREACRQELSQLESRVAAAPDDLVGGAGYRQVAIRCEAFDRSIDFFKRLVARHPASANARMNLGFAFVDKIPVVGDLRQALLGRSAIDQFSKSLDARTTWLACYTRGRIRLFYPDRFGQAKGAVADLERALQVQRAEPARPYHVRTFVTLGDAYYWRVHDLAKARRMWEEGAARFPADRDLRARLDNDVKVMREIVRQAVNADVRIDTSLRELAAEMPPARGL